MNDSAREEAALWERFRRGDSNALAVLFQRLYEGMALYGYKLMGEKSMVEDCVQELFADLLHKQPPPEVEFVRAYLFKSLRYKLIRVAEQQRSRQRREHLSQANAGEASFDFYSFESAQNDPEAIRQRQQLVSALDQLSPRQREIVYLRFYQNLSYEEIAEIMELNYQTSRNLLYKAIKALRKIW
jgi:RNA polymerase sigma-70 factor (ECF subfamily)